MPQDYGNHQQLEKMSQEACEPNEDQPPNLYDYAFPYAPRKESYYLHEHLSHRHTLGSRNHKHDFVFVSSESTKAKEAVNTVQRQALFLVPQVIEASLSCFP